MPSEHEKRYWAWLGCSVQHVIRCWVSVIKDANWASLNTYNTWFPLSIYRYCNLWSVFKDAQSMIYFSVCNTSILLLAKFLTILVIELDTAQIRLDQVSRWQCEPSCSQRSLCQEINAFSCLHCCNQKLKSVFAEFLAAYLAASLLLLTRCVKFVPSE